MTPFPLWDEEKVSKMFLTQEQPPSNEDISSFECKARSFLQKYVPSTLHVPHGMSEYKLGSSWYYDNGTLLHDSCKPHKSFSGPFLYQRFYTSPLVPREVWVPNKAYKNNSSWWHFFTNPIVERVPHITVCDTLGDLSRSLFRRFRPCKKIDLKGCGLQYPREYILKLMDILCEMFPDESVLEHRDLAKKLFANISVEVGDKHVSTLRGVGLGYYANLMTLCTAIVLSECSIVKMFSDDILVEKGDYDKAIEALVKHKLIVNEEKKWAGMEYFCPLRRNTILSGLKVTLLFRL